MDSVPSFPPSVLISFQTNLSVIDLIKMTKFTHSFVSEAYLTVMLASRQLLLQTIDSYRNNVTSNTTIHEEF
jgi:hypothetical protein